MKNLLLGLLAGVLVLAATVALAFKLSPWPSVLLIRQAFDKDTAAISEALAKHVPDGVSTTLDLRFDAGDPDGFLDVFRPGDVPVDRLLPAIVWVHGGAYVYGRRDNVRNYLKILAARGYATVAVDYTKAPAATYPRPLQQLNAALAFLQQEGPRLGIDPARIVLAGDSAGAQIVAQMAIIVTETDYARQLGITPALRPGRLKAVILHCGPHGTDKIDFDGPFGGFLRTVLWAYFGTRNFAEDPRLKEFSIVANMTKNFPPAFISVGSADPLAPLSYDLKARADELGVANEALFFPADHQPPLPHEYQFNLDGEAGKEALERTVRFLSTHLL